MLANYFFCELKNIHEIEDDINRLKNVCKFQNKNHECQKYSESITCSWIKIDRSSFVIRLLRRSIFTSFSCLQSSTSRMSPRSFMCPHHYALECRRPIQQVPLVWILPQTCPQNSLIACFPDCPAEGCRANVQIQLKKTPYKSNFSDRAGLQNREPHFGFTGEESFGSCSCFMSFLFL